METVRMEALPEDLRSRVQAATAHATHRHIRRLPGQDGPAYAVEAVSGDRVTLMRLSLRPDESVDESTDTFTTGGIADVDVDASELTVQGSEGARTVAIAPDTAQAVRSMRSR